MTALTCVKVSFSVTVSYLSGVGRTAGLFKLSSYYFHSSYFTRKSWPCAFIPNNVRNAWHISPNLAL